MRLAIFAVCAVAATTICFPIISQNAVPATRIPPALVGRWKVRRDLNLMTITCADQKEAERLYGTEIEFSPKSLRWGKYSTLIQGITLTTLNENEFGTQYSGHGEYTEFLSFQKMGVKSSTINLIVLNHPDPKLPQPFCEEQELPGDWVFLASPDRIIFEVGNVYFDAFRIKVPSKTQKIH